MKEIDKEMHAILSDSDFREIVDLIPSDWLKWCSEVDMTEDQVRDVYFNFLSVRFRNSGLFVNAADDERRKLLV